MKTMLAPSLQLSYSHEFSPRRVETADLVNLPGSSFVTAGAFAARDTAHVKSGGELAFNRDAMIFARFEGALSTISEGYTGQGGLLVNW